MTTTNEELEDPLSQAMDILDTLGGGADIGDASDAFDFAIDSGKFYVFVLCFVLFYLVCMQVY